MITIPASIAGATITGLTTPGYTLTVDSAVDTNQKQAAVTALTGTQTGVTAHSVSSPFTIAFKRPKTFSLLGKPNPVTGLISNVGRNLYGVLTRKGVTPAVNQPANVMLIRSEIEVPSGADTHDAQNVRACISAHIGALNQLANQLADTALNGVL